MSDLHVVLGAGPLGRAVAEESLARGARVRLVSRSGRMAEPPAAAEVRAADLTDHAAGRAACEGAAVVFLCANVPYTDWVERWPPLAEGALAAASAVGARLVYGDNLYMYGPHAGPLREDLPYAATGRKGRVRAAIATRFLDAHRAGAARVAIGRASDFYGPWATDGSLLGIRVIPQALAGRAGQVLGDVDQPHTFTFIRDYARGLVTLGTRDEALGRAWHVPSAVTTTPRALLQMVWEECGQRGPARFSAAPRWMVRAMGLFVPIMRELDEMMYEWERPYVVDHAAYAKAFGDPTTPHREALAETVAWYRAHPVTG